MGNNKCSTLLDADVARAVMRGGGMRLTPQRLMVVNALVGNRCHPTVEEVYHLVRQQYPAVSLATIYHTVALLAKHGLIQTLRAGADGLRCDPDTSSHAHAYCDGCGAVFDIPLPASLDLGPIDAGGFQTTQTEIALHGRCRRCRTSP